MSWVITPSFYGYIADVDAKDYLARVHAAEGQTLEPAVALAIEAFVVGCKADGIWNAIKASCILAGARTLAGALVPLAGAAPTNVDGLFVAADYNRKTGLVGDGIGKHLNSSTNANAGSQGQNNVHLAVYLAAKNDSFSTKRLISGSANLLTILDSSTAFGFRARTNSSTLYSLATSTSFAPGLIGVSRNSSTSFDFAFSKSYQTQLDTSTSGDTATILVFASPGVTTGNFSASRIAFYSIGEAIDLALLDARVTTLINAFDAAI